MSTTENHTTAVSKYYWYILYLRKEQVMESWSQHAVSAVVRVGFVRRRQPHTYLVPGMITGEKNGTTGSNATFRLHVLRPAELLK